MAAVKVETRKPATLAYIEHKGPYDEIPFEDFTSKLYAWAKQQKVIPGFYPMGIYHDHPEHKPPEQLRSEIAISFKGDARPAGDVKVRDLPEMKVAAVSFKGPSEDFRKSYDTLMSWIDENGYEWDGPAIEVYSKKPEMVDGKTILHAKIMAPVRKAGT